MTVELSKDFVEGTLNSESFRDIRSMSDAELKVIYEFMQLTQGGEIQGKNKPSWKSDDNNTLPNTQLYKENKLWHYHCGPYKTIQVYTVAVPMNINIKGKTSAQAIHYQKLSDDHIFIIAFSPIHQPFPKATSLLNPLLLRTNPIT
ncbi:hypothetical protein A1D22_11330 [Pasteurellaceae bacterium LFhippo2]|nr:hypothetical protein [Pasteurellaceae bacterium LFhippo2]